MNAALRAFTVVVALALVACAAPFPPPLAEPAPDDPRFVQFEVERGPGLMLPLRLYVFEDAASCSGARSVLAQGTGDQAVMRFKLERGRPQTILSVITDDGMGYCRSTFTTVPVEAGYLVQVPAARAMGVCSSGLSVAPAAATEATQRLLFIGRSPYDHLRPWRETEPICAALTPRETAAIEAEVERARR